MADISFYGALFTSGTDITPAIARAANIASTYGLALIKARTPVDTGELKSKWQIKLEGNGLRYTNEAFYAGFVEHGTSKMSARNMLASSIPEIEQVFYKELTQETAKQISAKLLTTTPDYGNSVNATDLTRRSFPSVGKNVADRVKGGLAPKKYTKKYLFANPNDILNKVQKESVNSAKPKWQKSATVAPPTFKETSPKPPRKLKRK